MRAVANPPKHPTKTTRAAIAALLTAVTASVARATAPAATASAAPSTPAPADLVISSTSWTTPDQGLVIGFRACGDDQCPQLLSTADGGESWQRRRPPPVQVSPRDIQVRVVQVPTGSEAAGRSGAASTTDAYVSDGHRVYRRDASDGTWSRVGLPRIDGRASIGEVVATARRVYAIVADGDADDGRTRLLSARHEAARWRPVDGVETPGNGIDVDGGWDLDAKGRFVAVALGRIFLENGYWTSSNGRTFSSHHQPCTDDQVPDVSVLGGGDVAALCSYEPGMSLMSKDLFISTDGGRFEPEGSAPDDGISQQYVSPARGEHVITAIGGAAFIYRGTGDDWETPVLLADGPPWADLQFVDAKHGFVVSGGPRSGTGTLYRTDDRGSSWTTVAVG